MVKHIDGGKKNDDRLPRIPKPTKAQQLLIDEQQREMAQRMSLTSASPEQRMFARAHTRKTELDAIPREDWTTKQLDQYVEALTVLGKYNEAFQLTGHDEYQQIWESIWRDDDEKCGCPDTSDVQLINGQATPVTFSRHFSKKKIYSLKHNKHIELRICNKCGDANSVPDAPPAIISV